MGKLLSDKRFPIALHNGDDKWTAACDIAELIPKVLGLVADYLPRLKYLLIDENSYAEAYLAPLSNLVVAVIHFEHPVDSQALIELIDSLNDWLDGKPELKKIFAISIRAVLCCCGTASTELMSLR